jgi:glycosyltransferase involved in cell wall biosynthesis
MDVLLDHQILDTRIRGGVFRYVCELISAIRKGNLAEIKLPRIYTDHEPCRPLLGTEGRPRDLRSFLSQKLAVKPSRRAIERVWRSTRSRLNERASIRELKRQEFDLFHTTYYDPYFLDHLQGKPFVLTIYDMIHEIHPDHFSPNDKTREHKALLARAATRIIAISGSTKSDIVRYLGVDPEKIEVIYLANSLACEGEALPVPDRFVLYVGGRCRRYKNFETFLRAFASLAAGRPDLHLICAGQKDFNPAELGLIETLGLGGRCLNIAADDRQLVYLYSRAALFVYPSLYEGFGLPILEAFAAGCPVALSQASCFPEIAGEAAAYFDPYDISSMAGVMEGVLADGGRRQALVRGGRERLKRFSWVATAEQTAALYRRCLREGGVAHGAGHDA